MKTILAIIAVLLLAGIVLVTFDVGADVPELDNEQPAAETAVSFQPSGRFSSADRQEVYDKVITPLIDYRSCMGEVLPVSLLVTPTDTAGYRYKVEGILPPSAGQDVAGYMGFLVGPETGELDYWVPDLLMSKCVDVLPNADQLRDQAIDEYQG